MTAVNDSFDIVKGDLFHAAQLPYDDGIQRTTAHNRDSSSRVPSCGAFAATPASNHTDCDTTKPP